MNSVKLYVRDAVGVEFLVTFTANTPENIASFRNHVKACQRYWRTAEYRKKVDPLRWPCFPVKVCIEPYEDMAK